MNAFFYMGPSGCSVWPVACGHWEAQVEVEATAIQGRQVT